MKIRCWICARFKEPSTWAALSVPLATWGSQMPEPFNYYIYSAAALCGILAIILKEGQNASNMVPNKSKAHADSADSSIDNNSVASAKSVGKRKVRKSE